MSRREIESPIENDFYTNLLKHLDLSQCSLNLQHEIATYHGKFRIDCLVTTNHGKKIVFECDGRRFHDQLRDDLRDSITLGDGFADVIYRIPGTAIVNKIHVIMWYISLFDPEIFVEKTADRLEQINKVMFQSSESALNNYVIDDVLIEAIDDEDLIAEHSRASFQNFQSFSELEKQIHYDVIHKNESLCIGGKRIQSIPEIKQSWDDLFQFACEHRGIRLDELVKIRKESK